MVIIYLSSMNDNQSMRIKHTHLQDNQGRKLSRKVRRDSRGLYIINHGMKGYLIKSVKQYDCDQYHVINITRKVDYYL